MTNSALMPDSLNTNEITFYSKNNKWNAFLIFFGLAVCFLIFLVFPYKTQGGIIIFILIVVGYLISADRLLKTKATIVVEEHYISISNFDRFLGYTTTTAFAKKDIRGFELSVRQYNSRLVLHHLDLSTSTLVIHNAKDYARISKFLSPHFEFLTKDSNPFFHSFKIAFRYALVRILFALLPPFAIVLAIMLFKPNVHDPITVIPGLSFVLTGSFLSYRLLVRNKMKTKKFRKIGQSMAPWLLLTFSNIAFGTLIYKTQAITEGVIKINSVEQIRSNPNRTLFAGPNLIPLYIENPVLNVQINRNHRSPNEKIQHHVMVPLSDRNRQNQSLQANIWVNHFFTQRLQKSLPLSIKKEQRQKFHDTTYAMLKNLFVVPPKFYKVVHSATNSSISNTFLASRLQYVYPQNTFAIILQPYWKSIKSYKSDLAFFILSMTLVIFLCITLCAVEIASQR